MVTPAASKVQIRREGLNARCSKMRRKKRLWVPWSYQFALLPQRDRAARAGKKNVRVTYLSLAHNVSCICFDASAAAGEGRRAKAERATARSALARGGAGYASAAAGEGRQATEEVSLVGIELGNVRLDMIQRQLPSPAAGGLSIAGGNRIWPLQVAHGRFFLTKC